MKSLMKSAKDAFADHWRIVLILVGLLAFVAAVAYVPERWVDQSSGLAIADRITAVAGVRQSVVFMGGGLLALVGIYYTHQRSIVERATNRLQQDSNYTDRYTAAITQLGSDNLTIRLGGVYALERIARDSTGDRETVEDVLAAFVRMDAPRAAKELEVNDPQVLFSAPVDILAAATVLSRRDVKLQIGDRQIDLSGAQLGSVEMVNATSLNDVSLSGANLHRALLMSAYMSGANLFDTNLRSANLVEANLTTSWLLGTHLENANLRDANLSGAHLYGAYLDGASLQGAILTDAQLNQSRLNGANLTSVVGWSSEQLEKAGSWDISTIWPHGHIPSIPTKIENG
ncbi:pentapeptide repeat-containing protein [Cryobacterium glucosi]|uniref:pentapeptide repeat-containing protein n=1 Tax=Cryobacterium glucosi TaxID=1259175 RepID=UPI00141BB73C|nr:pentapeptide repeat-containing protein [Cryobacterium glucosi]